MLAEWYFCCCISANPSDTETFLSILESLENPESDAQLLYLAYNELKYTEDRMQIYALPTVLKSLHRENFPAELKSTIKRYLKHLIEGVPEKVENSVRQLINLVFSNQPSEKIIQVVNTFFRESQHLPERRLTSTPYLELKEFLPETLVLAILADQLENHERLIDELKEEINSQDETSSPVSEFIQAALECQFGRLAFRLSALIVSLTSLEEPDRLRSLIAEKTSDAAQVEPDLLQTYAVVLFREPNLKDTATRQCRRIMQESLTLSELRNLIREVTEQNSRTPDFLFRRVGIQNTPNRIESLPIFYWQIALWELSSQIDALTTVDELVKFWSPIPRLPKELNITCSETDIPKQVKSQFKSLLNLRDPQNRRKTILSKVNRQKKFKLKNKDIWIFFSPWIARTQDPKNLYPTADEPALLIRLMGSVFVAIRLLQKSARDNFDKVEFSARLLAHASDVIGQVERRYNKGEAPQLTPALMGLFYFTRQQIKLAGTGKFESIDPEIFLAICDRGQNIQEKGRNISLEEPLFLNSVLPEVLISWILDAYPSAVSSKLSGRWLNLIPDVYNYHARERRHSFPNRQKAALVTRFLSPNYLLNLDERLNWKIERSKIEPSKNETWQVNHRKLLLTTQLHPNEWIELGRDDENVVWGSDPSAIASNRLVYTLELLDAIGYHLPDYKISPEELEQKFSEWKHSLNSVGQAKSLDRFTRLRLLEFLDSPILENRSEEQILLASVLLEYGSIYDLKNMLERVYPTEADGRTFKETESARQNLQVALLSMIYLRLEKHTKVMQEVHHDSDSQSHQRKAQNPQATYQQLQYAELFKEWVEKLLYLSNIHENAEDFGGLGVNLKNLRRASLEKQAIATIRAKTLNVELRNEQKLLVLPPGEQPLADLAIKAINYNPNRFTATIFYEDFDTAGVENLFKKVTAEIRSLNHESDRPLTVLAVVVDVVEIEQDAPDRWKYTFDCGFEFLLTYSSERSLSFKPGDRVKLPIRQFKEGDKLEWRVPYNPSIEGLPHRVRSGDINKISVEENWKEGQRIPWSWQRQLNRQTEQITDKVEMNLRLWDADISRRFCQCSQPLKRSVFAKLNARLEWVPLDLDFSDLLSQAFHSQQHSNIAVLTLIKETIGQFGEKVWRFSRQPGENYLIEQHRFLGNDAATLADAIANYQDRRDGAVGLLISVTPDFESGRVGLRLVTNAINPVALDGFYPNLSVPFDERNIRWRELFDRADEGLIAEKDDRGNWFFYLPENVVIPGYPRQVRVEWDKNSPNQPARNQQVADLLILQWKESEWRGAYVKGETPPYYNITPHKQDWAAFLNRWLNLPEKQYIEAGCRVSLKGDRSLGWLDREGDGFVPCLTSENLCVWVQAESLTMLSLEHQTKLPIGENREAEIFWVEWFEISTRPEIKNITLPPDASPNHRCIGIITLVPKSGTDGTQCQVVWQASQGKIEEQGLQIDNLAKLRINQGDKIVGQQRHGKWIFHIEKPRIRARALWSRKQGKIGKFNELLGTVPDSDGNDLEIAESKSSPGTLYWSHSLQGKIKSQELTFEDNSLWEDSFTNNTARYMPAFGEPSRQYKRAVLKLKDRLLVGNCKKWIGNEKVTIQTIELVLTQRDENKYLLRRRFNLRQIRDTKQLDTNSNTDRWEQKLRDYLLRKPPEPLRATFADNKGKLGFWLLSGSDDIRVPKDSSWKSWTLWVPLAPDCGKFVMGVDYDSNQARICLFTEQKQKRVLASCRLVPPLTLEEFRVNYCEAPALNTDVFLFKDKNIRLYYVGQEKVNSFTGEPYAETHHRFEMGYGETLLIPESQLEFDDGPFSKAQFSLFYGDQVKVVAFKKIYTENGENDQSTENGENHQKTQYIFNIKGIYLQWSEARQLYYQRSRYQIVHLLHLKPRENDIEISYIDGFNENAISQQRKFEPKRFKAYLTPESQARLSDRRQKWADNAVSYPVIFGRLDEERFRTSSGRDIYFDHVRLSFVRDSKGSCLFNRDMVFLSAGQIMSFKNDMGLTLKPPKGFAKEDIGEDAESLLLLRRSFSVRENLLKQVYEEKGENYFQDDRLLIQLTKNNEQKITSRLLIEGDSVPSRKASALLGAVSNLGKAGLLTTIVRAEDRGVVQIEYKPGIFVRLKPHQIQSRPTELPRGTIVRIEASDGKLSITRAAFGNAQYVSESIRPAVILPTNDTRRIINPEDWPYQGRFAIGGLSNIVARPGSYANDRWDNILRAEAMTNLMATQHPKIACLGKDAKGNYRIAPPSESFLCGRLTRIDNSLAVQYVRLNSEPTDSSSNPRISWRLLSFGDESVKHILARSHAESWRYHDNETFTWIPNTQEFQVEKLRNRDHTVWTGPIFFQLSGEGLRLRYTQSEFRRFGFPVEELIYALKQRGRSHCYPIAGISKFVAGRSQSPEYSLWIELAPGRLVELPVQLIVWRSGVNDKAKSLADLMHWQGFAPGDRVELELVSTDPLTVDRVALKNWIPGVRNAFGPRRCFLPVEAVDEQQGKITLGRGEFKIELPFADPPQNWQMAILTPENEMKGIAAGQPKRNPSNPSRDDVVFLGINDRDEIIVLGFESMTPVLDKGKADAWKSNPITGCLISEWHERFSLDLTQLENWIRAAGGALPVTVEGLHTTESQHRLFFSMRYQQNAALIPPGCVSLARVVDILPDGSKAMLRCGSGLITLPMRQIVSGIDKSLYTTVAAQLKHARVSLWLRREQNGEFKVGFSDDSGHQELLVESLDILLQKDGEGEVGLICQSIETKTLHWFPIQEAAWTTLSVEEFRDVFKSKGPFKVRRKRITRENQVGKTSIISMLAVLDVKDESEKLVVGQERFVKVVKQVGTNDENKQRYLVELLTTQVILDCEIYDRHQRLQPGETLPVEVLSHIKGSPELITVVPVGKKRQYLDLPIWMTKQLPESVPRLQIRDYLRWRKGEKLNRTNNQLDRLLCDVFNDAYGTYGHEARNSNPERQLEVAKQWERQNRYKPEINAAHFIMAILLLNKHEETKREAYELIQNLGRRALRSLHIEVLYQQWLRIEDNRQRTDGLWRRLRQLEADQHLYIPLKENSQDAIRQFCNAVEMRSDPELLPIANSLSAALGELSSTVEFDSYALITGQLIQLYHTLFPRAALKKLPNSHIHTLLEILKLIDGNKLDILLLEPLNYKEDNDFKDLGGIDLLAELFPQEQTDVDRKSWVLQQIGDLDELTEKCLSLQEDVNSLTERFQKLSKIQIIEE